MRSTVTSATRRFDRHRTIGPVDETARPILEVGAVLLGRGRARAGLRAGSPCRPSSGYLAVGLLVSPFTPGYVAEHDQLVLFADLGVVLLLFEVGIEVDLGRLRAIGRAALGRPAADRRDHGDRKRRFLWAGLEPPAPPSSDSRSRSRRAW